MATTTTTSTSASTHAQPTSSCSDIPCGKGSDRQTLLNAGYLNKRSGKHAACWEHVLEMTDRHPKFESGTHQCVYEVPSGGICGALIRVTTNFTGSYVTTQVWAHMENAHQVKSAKKLKAQKRMQSDLYSTAGKIFYKIISHTILT